VLSLEVEALPSLWEWVLAQLDDHVSVVPGGWHGEWKDDAETRGDTPGFARLSFLGQAVVFHLVRMWRVERPGLLWAPYRPRMGERDRWFLVPTQADDVVQLFPPMSVSFAMARASPWLEDDDAVRAVYREPDLLQRDFVDLAEGEPLPRARVAAKVRPKGGSAPGDASRLVGPRSTSEANPREVYLYRAKTLLDGVDPARCAPVDPVRLVAGLKRMGFEEVEQEEPQAPEDGMLLTEWKLDRPDGTAVAYALVYTSPGGRLRRGGVRKVELRIQTEADEGMSAAERAQGSWWHAGVMTGLRELAADVGARVVSREELESAPDDDDDEDG